MKAGKKFRIGDEIREILINTPAIRERIGEKVFPVSGPEDTDGDFILYVRDGYFVGRTKMGVYEHRCRIHINAISESYARAVDLADLIYEALEGSFLNPEMEIRLEDSTEDYEEGKYFQVLTFTIK